MLKYANTKCSLVSAFIARCLDQSAAEQAGLCLPSRKLTNANFLATRLTLCVFGRG